MKKIIVSAIALTFLLTGCAQSKESLYEEVVSLCDQYLKMLDPKTAATDCDEVFKQYIDSPDELLKFKEGFQKDIDELKNK